MSGNSCYFKTYACLSLNTSVGVCWGGHPVGVKVCCFIAASRRGYLKRDVADGD